MLAPATVALAQAVAETRGKPPTTGSWQAQPLAGSGPDQSWEFQVSPAPPVSEALRGSPPWAFPPQTQGPGFMAGASFPGTACITGFWSISPRLPGKFPRAH